MNIISQYEAYGLTITLMAFVIIYAFVHIKYIRQQEAHKRFLAALWDLMKNTIHGENIRTMGYNPEKEQKKR